MSTSGATSAIIEDLGGRLNRLEQERDFYKELLDSPARPREISPPEAREDI